MPSLAIDLTYGLEKEQDIMTTLSKFFEKDLKKTTDHYCPFDFEDEEKTISIELKSRRNCHNTYPTTLIPVHKITDDTKNLYFVFQFTNGVYFIKYEKEVFDKFNTCYITARERTRGAMHYLIPVELLTILSSNSQ